MPRWLHALPPALLLAAALVSPVRAGMFDDEEARMRIEVLKGEVAELAKRADTINRNQIDFANQVEAVKADIAKLRGQIEVLTYEIEATQKRQKDFYVDLDNRLRKLEPPPADAKPESQVAAPKADPAQETRDYEAALAGLKASKFREAGASFVAFIKAYPNGGLTASAHYWGAYAHAQAKDHAAAAELFGKFAAGWPNDDRAPAALESRVASLEALKDWKNARATLEQLAERYPNSEAGKKAKLKLKKK
ncbi:MAG: tetratricopeptide repeat protein [Sulfuritalea sp.]|jgi:tol-pal system protein YbgF|nr:tetratricopeptide repeat protein [Sulfuritalea sp.]